MAYEVFLVNVSKKDIQIQLPIWLTTLVNALKLHDIEPNVVDVGPIDIDERDRFVYEQIPSAPAVIGFNIMCGNDNINQVERFARMAKDVNPDHIIIYGGALPSSAPDLLIEKCGCDSIVVGEGELALPAFLKSVRGGVFYPKDIAGLCYKRDNTIVKIPQERMVIASKSSTGYQLGELSRPDYSLVDMDFYIDYLKETDQSFDIMASRGCKGNCFFCHRVVRGLAAKRPDAILDEISEVIDGYGLDRFYFVDENFLELKSVFREFIEKKQKRGMNFTFRGQSRADAIDEDICALGRDNNLASVTIGIESVRQETLNKMGKGIKIADVEKNIDLLRKYDISVMPNFIVGFPWDTENDYIEMIDFIKRNGLERYGKINQLTPLPGTRLWSRCLESGQIKDELEFIKSLGNIFFERSINLTSLPDEVIDHYFQEITALLERPVVYPKSQKYLAKLGVMY